MKPRYLILLLLSAVVIVGFVVPGGVSDALVNNLWSIDFIRYHADQESSQRLTSPPSTHTHAGLFLARKALQDKDLDLAQEQIMPLVESAHPVALNAYASILYQQGNYEKACEIWSNLGQQVILEEVLRQPFGEDVQAVKYYASLGLYHINPEKFTSVFASTLISAQNADSALTLLDQSIQVYPESKNQSTWLRYKGDIYRDQQKYSEAENVYWQALQVNPEDGTAWRNLGLMFASDALKDYQQAAECFEAYVNLNPNQTYGYLLLAKAYESNGQPDQASGAYLAVLEIDPENTEAQQALQRLSGSN